MKIHIDELDEIDNKIINLLAANARMSFVEIGNEVGLSRVAVKMRIQALEKQGVIEKYSIIINPEKIGNSLAVFFDLKISGQNLNHVCETLKQVPQITKIYQMTGDTRLHIHAMLKSNTDLEDFLKNQIYVLPGLLECSCNTIIARIKDNEQIRI